MVSPLLLSRSEKGYRKCRCFVEISLRVHQIIICGKNGRTVRTACPCGCDSDPYNTQQTQTHPMFLTGGSTQNASTRSTTHLIERCFGRSRSDLSQRGSCRLIICNSCRTFIICALGITPRTLAEG